MNPWYVGRKLLSSSILDKTQNVQDPDLSKKRERTYDYYYDKIT